MELKQSPVLFDEQEHIYTLDGIPLSGITSIINTILFPNKYNDVPVSVLAKAAERGHKIHAILQDFVTTGAMEACEELQNFIDLCATKDIHPMVAEYLVSDEENVASSIDMVDTDYNLYDYKTTYSLDTRYVSWQLSIYAYLFELQNPSLKAGKLFAIHLRNGKATLVEVERKPADACKALIEAYINETPFEYTDEDIVSDELTKAAEIAEKKLLVKAYLEELEQQEAELIPQIIAQMKDRKIDTADVAGVHFKYTAASERKTFDSTKFKAENAELYNKYIKKTKIAEGIRISIK